MKRLLVAMLFTLSAFSASSADTTEWATAISKQEGTGRAIVFRYAKAFGQGFQRSAFADRIIIVWQYKSTTGMPASEEHEAMDRMEDLLAPLVEKSGISVLALVSTGDDLREWTYYSRSEEEFFAALNKALAGQPRFPIEIHAASDPAWLTYERFRQGIGE